MRQSFDLPPKMSDFSLLVLIIIAIVLIILSLCRCSSLPTTIQNAITNPVYKYDISGSVNGTPFTGVGVIPYAQSYNFKIISPVNVDMLTITSCNRDVAIQGAISVGWFQSNGGYPYTYTPDPVENHLGCLIKFGAYNKSKGQNAWGILLPENPVATLAATVVCNGHVQSVGGVSICQSRAGLKQEIVFSRPVKIALKDIKAGCVPQSQDNLAWTYETAIGTCAVDFMTIQPPYQIHYMESVGYNQVQIR